MRQLSELAHEYTAMGVLSPIQLIGRRRDEYPLVTCVHSTAVNQSRVSVRVMSVRAASSNNTAESKYDMLVSSMTIIAHNSLVFYSSI